MKRKHLRLPNGFGQITKLKGSNLRKPYRAMITVGKTDLGKPISKLLKPQAYFETYNDAYAALIDQKRNPYEAKKDATLKEIYEEWFADHSKKVSSSRQRDIRFAWRKIEKYHNTKLADLKPRVIGNIFEELSFDTGPNLSKIKSLLNAVMDYAVMNEIIDKNYSRISNIKIENSREAAKSHITFTNNEISALWKDKDNFRTRWVLIQCYTGMRPLELCTIKLENINLDQNYMTGGMKTKAGKDRIIPIHPAIKDLISKQIEISVANGSDYLVSDDKHTNITYTYYKRQFYKVTKKLELSAEHRPHDCRKFFITQAKKYQLDEYILKEIVGHAITDITEKIYTVRDPESLFKEICKIVV